MLPLLYLSKVEGQVRVKLGSEMASHHLVKVEVHRTRIGKMAMGHICLYAYVAFDFYFDYACSRRCY
jgi:hypothetical protein